MLILSEILFHLEIWWNWLFKPYNKVRLPELDRTWHDIDQRIIHANFSLLAEFMEFEFKNNCWDHSEEIAEVAKELKEAYYWWKDNKHEFRHAWCVEEDNGKEAYEEETKHLMNIIKYRSYLWS